MKPNSIHLSIRRDRNGYFSAKIHADGKEITRVPYQYGCGSYPFAIALVAARQAGVAFGDLRDFTWTRRAQMQVSVTPRTMPRQQNAQSLRTVRKATNYSYFR